MTPLHERRDPGAASREHHGTPPESRSRVWLMGLLLLTFATAGAFALGKLAANSVLVPAVVTRAAGHDAPELVGKDLEEARERANDAGISLDVLGSAYSSHVDSGDVLVQFPPPGLPVESNKPIEVVVSGGAGRTRVPDLGGVPEVRALALLKTLRIPVARVHQVSGEGFEKGTVVGSEPPAGGVLARGDSLVLSVSQGSSIVEVPNVVGQTRAKALELLRDAQLVAGDATYAAGVTEGSRTAVVIEQDPPSGGLARSGMPVNLRFGRPPERGERPAAEPFEAREPETEARREEAERRTPGVDAPRGRRREDAEQPPQNVEFPEDELR